MSNLIWMWRLRPMVFLGYLLRDSSVKLMTDYLKNGMVLSGVIRLIVTYCHGCDGSINIQMASLYFLKQKELGEEKSGLKLMEL